MKLVADTNILVRAIVEDDPAQAELARAALSDAELIAIPIAVFCELDWVLRKLYKFPAPVVAQAIRRLVQSANVVTHQPAIESGLTILESGGDFADGVIAFEGIWLGAETFVTFDKRAAALLASQGTPVRLLTAAS